ncbi:MAG: hypothetical protein E7342_04600 [Clostridiales bacterium]|nr:hypothetical protein [Clostridiales bacterium]
MVVYIEYALIDNILIDYWLLKFTLVLTKNKVKFWRLLFCAFLGSIFSLITPLIKASTPFLIVIKVIMGLLIVLLSTKFRNIKTFITAFIIFLSYTFLLGGSILGILSLLSIPLSEVLIAFLFVPCYILIKLTKKVIKLLSKKMQVLKSVVECSIIKGKVKLNLKGFYDTGNNLYDKEGNPVLIIDKKTALKLIDITSIKNLEWVETTTVLGKSKIPLFTVDKVEINLNDKIIPINEVKVGISKALLSVEYDVILHSKILEDIVC